MNKLNTDIVSGNVPDILVLNSQLPVNSYVAKGLFEDLYPFIDKDPDLERADYLPNILEAFSVDGKLYQLVPSFGIQTAVAKTSDVGPEPGWTLQDLKALMATKPGRDGSVPQHIAGDDPVLCGGHGWRSVHRLVHRKMHIQFRQFQTAAGICQ